MARGKTTNSTGQKSVKSEPTPARSRTRATPAVDASAANKRSYLRQSDVPTTSLEEALRLPEAIFDHYAGKPTAPFNVAKALNV